MIFAFSFLFRAAFIFRNAYPPGSDIGFHSSIINLILDQGELPNWNTYHMGGETLATPPGFHYFVTTLILVAGMPLILAELITAVFYSSVIVFPAYLVSKKIWNSSSAGLLAAFFATFSSLSLEMINWGGYTNIVSLTLIVIIFYLALKDVDKPKLGHLIAGTLLFGSLILTHTFSLFVVFPILGFYLVLSLIGKWKKTEDIKLKSLLRFVVVSVAAGIVAVLPWILRVFSFYVEASSGGAATGGLDNRDIILAQCYVDSIIMLLVIAVVPALFMFKDSRKKMFDSHSFLLIAWFLVPLVLTQAHLFGVIIDYKRFLYFIDLPVIIISSAGLLYIFRYTTIAIKRAPKIRWNSIKKILQITALTSIIFVFVTVSPQLIFPDKAFEMANFYTTIHEPEATTLEWIRNNTPENSVLVADHNYGWWLGGIGERTTLSAADLEFLIYSHELEVAQAAKLLFDTHYYLGNGLIQVRDNGRYVSGKNTEISIDRGNEESVPVFNIQEEGIVFWYILHIQGTEINGIRTVAEMETIGTPAIIRDENSATLIVKYEDELFTVNRTLTVKRGERFAELSYNIDVKGTQTNLYNVWLSILVGEGNMTRDESMSWYGFYNINQTCGQVIFQEHLPAKIEHIKKEPNKVETLFVCPNQKTINIKMLVGVFDAQDLSWPDTVEPKYLGFLAAPQEPETTDPLLAWDYTEMIEKYGVSFVVCRDQQGYLNLVEDTSFRLVFNSGNIAVFQVVE